MAGERLEAAPFAWHGVAGDRRWAFLFEGDTSRFPWFTGRRLSPLVRWTPELADPDDPEHSRVAVRDPEGTVRDVDDPALRDALAEGVGRPLRLIRSGRALFDAFPVSILGTGTVRAIGERAGHGELDHRRFRPNVLVEADPSAEESCAAATLQLGDRDDAPRIRIDTPNERCVGVAIAPGTAVRD